MTEHLRDVDDGGQSRRETAHLLERAGVLADDLVVGAGIANEVWLTPDHVVRLSSGRFRDAFAYEAEVLRRLPVEIPRPLVLAHGKREGEGEYLVLERLPGVTMDDAWPFLPAASRRALVHEIADIMRRLHALEPEAWMANPWAADAMAGKYADAYHAPPGLYRELIRSARRARPDASDVLARTGAFIASRLDAFAGDIDVPIHTDLHFRNVLVDGDHISGIIDFEGFRLGPADIELDMLLRSIRWALLTPGGGSMDYEMVPHWFGEAHPALFAHPRLIERLEVYEALWHLVQLHWHPAGDPDDPEHRLERLLEGEFQAVTSTLLTM